MNNFMDDITLTLASLVGEAFEEIEREVDLGFVRVTLRIEYPLAPYERDITEPVELTYEACWVAGEMKYVRRIREDRLA
jgi:hypothetical protein